MVGLRLSPWTLQLSCGAWHPLLSPFKHLAAGLQSEAGRTGVSVLPMQVRRLRLRHHVVYCEELGSSYVMTAASSIELCLPPQIPNAHLPHPPHPLTFLVIKSHNSLKKRERTKNCNSFSVAKKSYASSSNELSQKDGNSILLWFSCLYVSVWVKWSGSQASVLSSVKWGLA